MATYQPGGDFVNQGIDVGSVQSLDEYAGLGTQFLNPDRFFLDISDRIHMLGPKSSPFISWLQMVRSRKTGQIEFKWIESELFTQRDLKCRLRRSIAHGSGGCVYSLALDSGADWQAFMAAAKADSWAADNEKPLIFMTIINAATTTEHFSAVIDGAAIRLGQTMRDIQFTSDASTALSGVLNHITVYDTGDGETELGGAAGELRAIPADMGVEEDFTGFTTAFDNTWFGGDTTAVREGEVFVSVNTPNDFLKGYAQGSGLPTESRKRSRSLKNFTQIFKTPYSISGTLKAITENGGTRGGSELARKRLEKAVEHKIDMETAILFQAGGVEDTDWGILADSSGDGENPLTRFKGLGVGLAVNGLTSTPGFIVTKNADLDSRYQLDVAGADMEELNRIMGMVFDDNVDNPSNTKVCYCSQKWLTTLSNLALKDTGNGLYTFGQRIAAPGSLGLIVKDIVTPVGNLTLVHNPRFRGKYEDYALVVDFQHMEMRPLVARNTMLKANVATQEVDGQVDYYLTETGFECRHESCHAVLKLG